MVQTRSSHLGCPEINGTERSRRPCREKAEQHYHVCVWLGTTSPPPVMPSTYNLCTDLFLSLSNTLNTLAVALAISCAAAEQLPAL